jgi:hypothetical protein
LFDNLQISKKWAINYVKDNVLFDYFLH